MSSVIVSLLEIRSHNRTYSTALLDSEGKQETVNDPTCGSGRMLLAAASFNRDLIFNGADIIDLTCCKMDAVNMLLNSLKATISWGDFLMNKFQFAFGASQKSYSDTRHLK